MNQIEKDYFEWLFDLVCKGRYSKEISYRDLLTHLYTTEFIYFIPKDSNRAADGLNLRYRFSIRYDAVENAESYLTGPCSVLEMMIGLATRCEETIMDDPSIGNRTGQWFWKMIVNLGLGDMTDTRYDEEYVWSVIDIFLHREYEPNGRGGLFTVTDCECDLRNVEIWVQMLWFLDHYNT